MCAPRRALNIPLDRFTIDSSGLLHLKDRAPPPELVSKLVNLLQQLRQSAAQQLVAAHLAPDSEGDEGADCLLWLDEPSTLEDAGFAPIEVRKGARTLSQDGLLTPVFADKGDPDSIRLQERT